MLISRKEFLMTTAAALLAKRLPGDKKVMTINGPISIGQLGRTLVHEHFLVDFIGADKISYDRWDRSVVLKKVLPFVLQAKQHAVKTMFDCTPAFLGRDVTLLKLICEETGMQVVTNTGYYGAVDNKFLPAHAFSETGAQISQRWTREFEEGIEGTGVRPGFIKIGVNPGRLSGLHKKLVEAAALTHKATGLTICSHTGKAPAAFEQMQLLEKLGVKSNAFVWVHAQDETDKNFYYKAIAQGSWVSLDGIGWGKPDRYVDLLADLKSKKLLHRVLISHDAGWYKPGETGGGDFNAYTPIFEQVLPKLQARGFSAADIDQLLIKNPASAFALETL
ncbi:MAG: hypothetical protein Q7T76_00930 [Ferruginibacter sp.]|nr:hypothetical protein [Ferruginibacter sp.]